MTADLTYQAKLTCCSKIDKSLSSCSNTALCQLRQRLKMRRQSTQATCWAEMRGLYEPTGNMLSWDERLIWTHRVHLSWQLAAEFPNCMWANALQLSLQIAAERSWHIVAELTHSSWADRSQLSRAYMLCLGMTFGRRLHLWTVTLSSAMRNC